MLTRHVVAARRMSAVRRGDAVPTAPVVAWDELAHGMSVAPSQRVAVVTASARNLPGRVCTIDSRYGAEGDLYLPAE